MAWKPGRYVDEERVLWLVVAACHAKNFSNIQQNRMEYINLVLKSTSLKICTSAINHRDSGS